MSCNLRYLMISRHDYRSSRKASVHFIARELAKLGTMRFFSSSFSYLSYLTHDVRLPLWKHSNQVEITQGVQSYLWRTLVHPSKVPRPLRHLMDYYFATYAAHPPHVLRDWVRDSDVVLLESGGPEMFFSTIKRINPACKVIYICSDTLDVIGTSDYCVRALSRAISKFDGIRIPSKAMVECYRDTPSMYFVPHGIDTEALETSAPSPYRGGVNVVSVGNMLFDSDIFRAAAPAYPEVTFHVIGGGQSAATLSLQNIKIYPEMPFAETLPYLRHADAGLAPYKADRTPAYLADTSMKLMQYRHFGLPAICPENIAGEGKHRFGYAGSRNSIITAVGRALEAGKASGFRFLDWAEVTQRILYPTEFADTSLG